jgi:hypothetical protein
MRLLITVLTVILLSSWMMWSCRGKEGPQGPPGPQGPAGPQGPPGQDLTRPQNGYIEGRARGKDNGGNPFDIPFRYTYYFSLGTYRFIGPDSLRIEFERGDSTGIGSLSLSFNWGRRSNTVTDVTIEGTAADISQSPVPTYTVSTLPALPPLFPGTSQSVSNLSLSGDTLRGSFQYVRPSYNNIPGIGTNTHPDTVSGTFLIKLVQVRSYNRSSGQ